MKVIGYYLIVLVLSLQVYGQLSKPDPYFPVNNSIISSGFVTLRWNKVCGAAPQTLLLTTDESFGSNVSTITGILADTIAVQLLGNQHYYWKIKHLQTESIPYHFYNISISGISNLSLWLDDDLQSFIRYPSGRISQWKDKSNSGHNAEALIENQAPTLITSAGVGTEVQFLSSTLKSRVSSSSNLTIIVLIKPYSLPNTYAIYLGTNGSSQPSGIRYGFGLNSIDPGFGLGWGGISNIGFGPINSVFQASKYTAVAFVKNAVGWNIYANNQFVRFVADNSVPASGTLIDWVLGAEIEASAIYAAPVAIKNLAIFNSVLNAEQRELATNFMLNKVAPPVSLGPNLQIVGRTVTAGNFVTYLWSTGDTTSAITPQVTGNYGVMVTDLFGRVSTDTIYFEGPPVTNKPATNDICISDTIKWNTELSIEEYNFTWNGQTPSKSSKLIITTTGIFTLLAENTVSGCTLSDTLRILSVVGNNLKQRITLGNDTIICKNDTIQLRQGANFIQEYLWNNGDITSTKYVVTNIGTYMVKVRAFNGCTARDTLNVIAFAGVKVAPTFSMSSNCAQTLLLFSDNTNLQQTSIIQKRWLFDGRLSTDSVYKFNSEGSYNVGLLVTTAGNCIASTNRKIVINPAPITSFSNTLVCTLDTMNFANTSTISVGSITGFFWQWSNGLRVQTQNPKVVFTTPGIYNTTLTAVSNKGCAGIPYVASYVVKGGVIPDFTYNAACVGRPVFFAESTVYPDSLQGINRLWELENTTLSGSTNTAYVFTSAGLYNLRLTVRATNGCVNRTKKLVKAIAFPDPKFETGPLCLNQDIILKDISTVQGDTVTFRNWSLPRGLTSNAKQVVIKLENANPVTVQLEVSNQGCGASTSKQLQASTVPSVAFKPIRSEINPQAPLVLQVQFADTTVQYIWRTSNAAESTGSLYTFTAPEGTYTVTLTGTNKGSCSASAVGNVLVNNPLVDLALEGTAYAIANPSFIDIAVRVRNVGNRSIDSFYVTLNTTKGPELRQLYRMALLPKADSTFIIGSLEHSNNNPLDGYCVTVSLPVADNTDNNEQCKVLQSINTFSGPYPNPSRGVSYLQAVIANATSVQITLYNSTGSIVKKFTENYSSSGIYIIELPGNQIPTGWYSVEVRDGNTVKRFKMLRQ